MAIRSVVVIAPLLSLRVGVSKIDAEKIPEI